MNNNLAILLIVGTLAAISQAELMSALDGGDDLRYWMHQKRLADTRSALYDTINALDRLSNSPISTHT